MDWASVFCTLFQFGERISPRNIVIIRLFCFNRWAKSKLMATIQIIFPNKFMIIRIPFICFAANKFKAIEKEILKQNSNICVGMLH